MSENQNWAFDTDLEIGQKAKNKSAMVIAVAQALRDTAARVRREALEEAASMLEVKVKRTEQIAPNANDYLAGMDSSASLVRAMIEQEK